MPLWTNTAAGITNKPKFLTDDANSNYDRTLCYATNQGWVMRAGSAATGNGNTGAQEEVLVAIGGLAGTSTSTGLGRPTITRVRWGESSYTGAVSITVNVTWDEAVLYDAGTAATLAIVSTGTNITATATHIDNVAITTGLGNPTITRVRWGESAYTGAVAITVNVTWDEAVLYDAGSAATLAIVSTGTNITATATHIDGVSIADGLTGATITFTGTTVDESVTLSIADDTVIGDPDLKDALGAQDAIATASKTITAAVKTASGYATRAVTAA